MSPFLYHFLDHVGGWNGRLEVLRCESTTLRTTVTRADEAVVLEGTAVTYTRGARQAPVSACAGVVDRGLGAGRGP